MRKFINILVLVVALVGTVSAQNLDDLSKKVFDLSIGVINKGINAYEEQLEKQELEEALEAKKALEEAKKTVEEAKKAVEEAKKTEEDSFEAKKAEEEAKKAIKEASKAIKEAKKAVEVAKKAEEDNFEEERKTEDEDEYWEAIDILNRCVFCDPINKDIFVKCYCYPIEDFVWYRAFLGTDGKIWVIIFYDDNDEIGKILFAGVMQEEESTSYTESVTGIKTPALKITFTSGDLLFIQDTSDPYRFTISW